MPEETQNKPNRILLWIAGIAVLVFVGALIARSFFRDATPVRVAQPEYADLITAISTNGKVEPVQDFEAHALAPAVLQKLNVIEGQLVQKGQLLLSMDDSSTRARLAGANASLAISQNNAESVRQGGTSEERINISGDLVRQQLVVDQSQRDLNALQQLQSKGAASAGEVTAAQQRLSTAQSILQTIQQRHTGRFDKSDLHRVQSQIADSQANLAAAQVQLAASEVRAPYNGTVYSLPVRQSDFIPEGGLLLRMADLTRMQVRAYFDEPEIGKLAIGQGVTITWDAKPDRIWHGIITHVPSTIINYGTRNVGECTIAITDAHGDLLPNTNVNVRVTTQRKFHVMTISREGLHTQGSENYVYRVVHDRLVKTDVAVGSVNLTQVEITMGLSTGDIIALNATTSADLAPGLHVKAVQ